MKKLNFIAIIFLFFAFILGCSNREEGKEEDYRQNSAVKGSIHLNPRETRFKTWLIDTLKELSENQLIKDSSYHVGEDSLSIEFYRNVNTEIKSKDYHSPDRDVNFLLFLIDRKKDSLTYPFQLSFKTREFYQTSNSDHLQYDLYQRIEQIQLRFKLPDRIVRYSYLRGRLSDREVEWLD